MSHVDFTSACTLASVFLRFRAAKALWTTKTTTVEVVLEGRRHSRRLTVALPHRKGETHDVFRNVIPMSVALRCEADGVTEARDDKQAYHQLQ